MRENTANALIPGYALLLLVSLCGCKNMTDLQMEHAQVAAEEQAAAEDVLTENQEAIDELDEEQLLLKRKAKEIAARLARDEQQQEAARALDNGDSQRAVQLVQELLAANPEDAATPVVDLSDPNAEIAPPPMAKQERGRLYVILGTAKYDLGDTSGAIGAYQQALEFDPDYRPTRINLGKLLFMEERFDEALEVWQKELAAGFRSGDLLFGIGQALWEVGNRDQDDTKIEAARIAVRESLVEKPDDKEIRRWLAVLEFEAGRYTEATRLFQLLLKVNPTDPYYLELLANCYLKTDQPEKAIDTLELFVRTNDGEKRHYISLGDLYAQMKLPDAAAEAFMKAYTSMDVTPTSDRLYIASLLADAGRDAEAEKWFRSIAKTDPKYADALAELASLLIRGGKIAEALETLKEVRTLRPSDGYAHLMAGDLYLDQKELVAAVDAYSRAQQVGETKADGLAGLGEVSYEQGNLDEAIRFYQSALKERPSETRFQIALQQIESERSLNR